MSSCNKCYSGCNHTKYHDADCKAFGRATLDEDVSGGRQKKQPKDYPHDHAPKRA